MLLLGAIGLPLLAALVLLIVFALGIHPVQGRYTPSLIVISQLFDQPALWRSLALSLSTGIIATLLAVVIVIALVSHYTPHQLQRKLWPWTALLLSTPYLAFVVGWQFVISPSGLGARLVAQFTGQDIPAAFTSAPDAWFIGYVLMLAVKESGFLLVLLLTQLSSHATERHFRCCVALGYSPAMAWRKVLLPLLYPRLRLGIWILLVYSITNVEVALFAAPNLPELLSLRIVQWYNAPDIDMQFVASAAVVLLLIVVALVLGTWLLVERCGAPLFRIWQLNNKRGSRIMSSGDGSRWLLLILYLMPLVVLGVWSIVVQWSFPHLLPTDISLRWWQDARIGTALSHSVLLALGSGLLALVVSLVYVELSKGRVSLAQLCVLYAPLVMPQVALAAGLALNAHLVRLNGTLVAVVWSHLMLMVPYMVLMLAPVWAGYDKRYTQVARSLGRSWWYSWWNVKLPLCLKPVLFALAVGMSVSINLYIPTLFLGEGRVPTLMTEMVGLGVSYDRRQLGVFSLWLFALPFLAFACASAFPLWRYGRVEIVDER